MLSENEVEKIILDAIESLNDELEDDEQLTVSPQTCLFGAQAEIDSLSLVSVVVDIETELNSEHEYDISLTDDRAMTREVSPFTDVQSLKTYVLELVGEHHA